MRVLEGIGQQAATAPVAGFIAEAPLRAGDHVTKGDLLLRLLPCWKMSAAPG